MIYLIGGAPRVGKTQLVQRVLQKKPMHAVSTDAIRHMLRKTIPSDVLPPEIASVPNIGSQPPTEIVARQNQESEALWPYLVELMQSYNEDGYDLLVEGVAVLPHLVAQLHFAHRAIVVSNNDSSHGETLLKLADQNTSDWLHKFDAVKRANLVAFFQELDVWLQQQCYEHQIPLSSIHDVSFDADMDQAADLLLAR